jgi:hypothetical protein
MLTLLHQLIFLLISITSFFGFMIPDYEEMIYTMMKSPKSVPIQFAMIPVKSEPFTLDENTEQKLQ